jgi:protein TonB
MSYQALLFCPDEKTARVVTQVLAELDFAVEPCNEPFAAVKKLMAQHYDAIVVDCDNEQNAALLFKSARNSGSNQSSLAVAVVEGQAGVAKAFRIGANLVLTKPINVEQSKGTLRVARGLLRKADSGKPSGAAIPEARTSPAHSTSETPRPVAAPAQKPLVAAFTTPSSPPAAPRASESGFERESEPGPKPEPSEVALLESMPDPMSAVRPLSGSSTAKEYPWQPVSKLAEPMASALRIAAETAAQSSTSELDPVRELPEWGPPSESPKEIRPFTGNSGSSMSSNSPGAGAATAPAKEDVRPDARTVEVAKTTTAAPVEDFKAMPSGRKASVIPMEASPIDPPTFAALAVKDHEEDDAEEGGKKAYVIMALVVIAAIFTAYVGYSKVHSTAVPPTTQTGPVQTPASSSTPGAANGQLDTSTPAPAPGEPGSGAAHEITLSSTKPSDPSMKKPASEGPLNKPSAGIQTFMPSAKPAEVETPAAEAIVVKHDAPRTAPKTQEAEIAPPTLPSSPDNKALSGLVQVTPTLVAKPVATTLKVSQGVSQGLLMKRVQPNYPQQALQMRMEGTVLLEANVTKDGRISNVKVLKGDNILAKAAVDAVKQWKYNPYFLNGEPVEIQTQISVTFKLP